jgi:glycosyltransferase involved in cell wall biosynthesis
MTISEPQLALLHHSFGPYHVARARALVRLYPGRVRFLRLAKSESLRAWLTDDEDLEFETAVEGTLDAAPLAKVVAGLDRILERAKPDVIAIAGYGDASMRHAARWARRRGARTIMMSDSQARDWPRRPWREWLKRRWVSRHFDAAFVSGASAASYAESLGFPPHRIWRGYDVVDNEYFAKRAALVRADGDRIRQELGLPERFFLFVGRLSPEKNLSRMVDAFAAASQLPTLQDWAMVLVGSGPLEESLRRQAARLGDRVRFAGFQQLESLPSYYALASALVLPSISEPWGLVVNEAMASGLPVIISGQCGCVMDLVFPGVNGVVVDPQDPRSLESAFVDLAADVDRRRLYGESSARIVQSFSPETWSRALIACGLALR